jgi:hypothetical protein
MPMTFRVVASDQDGDDMHYIWRVGGMDAGEDADSLVYTFTQDGSTYVSCTVIDFCKDSTFTTWSFTVVGVETTPTALNGFEITGNYPNPFNPGTTIEYRTPDGSHHITMELLDASGKTVMPLVDSDMPGGVHQYRLNGEALPSGTYIVRLSSGNTAVTRSIILVK